MGINSSNKLLKENLNAGRRHFLKLGGATIAVTGLVLVGCSDDDMQNPGGDGDNVFDLGSGDVGILNYAYALEQLEADFYTKVVNSFYTGATDIEMQVFTDIYHHEVIHRDFFKAAITAAVSDPAMVLPTLEFTYDGVDFTNRDSVLATAKALEDTGVGAYNGAGNMIENADYLLIAGKIVSVEARHAAAIRSLINPDSADFAGDDVIDANGLDVAKSPAEVVPVAKMFITTEFTANNL